jgi:hypothetical protein
MDFPGSLHGSMDSRTGHSHIISTVKSSYAYFGRLTMREFRSKNSAQQWARVAMKIGLLLTDAKTWANMAEHLSGRAEDFTDGVKRKYDDMADRFKDARSSLRGESDWVGPTVSFLGGVAVGAGLGILFAPTSGERARAALRATAVDVKNKVSTITETRFCGPGTGQSTGTEGD